MKSSMDTTSPCVWRGVFIHLAQSLGASLLQFQALVQHGYLHRLALHSIKGHSVSRRLRLHGAVECFQVLRLHADGDCIAVQREMDRRFDRIRPKHLGVRPKSRFPFRRVINLPCNDYFWQFISPRILELAIRNCERANHNSTQGSALSSEEIATKGSREA